jgi:starch phosphorylase
MAVTRYMVQGADVWLNNPLRPLEASGTSGMKALANGVLNLSILDGWWDEAWKMPSPECEPAGWAIGHGEIYPERDYQDQVEAEALYDLLERDVVPTFYDRRANGLPSRWIARMKSALCNLAFFFNTHRMVQEYTEKFYLVAHGSFRELSSADAAKARGVAAWKGRVRETWSRVRVEVERPAWPGEIRVDTPLSVRAKVYLGELSAEEVSVELYLGRLNADGDFQEALPLEMKLAGGADGASLFEASAVSCSESGRHGFTVRVLPYHPNLMTPFLPGLIAWA